SRGLPPVLRDGRHRTLVASGSGRPAPRLGLVPEEVGSSTPVSLSAERILTGSSRVVGMRTVFRWIWWMAAVPALIGADSTQTVVLVRHAERAGGMAPEIGLSDAGKCRAQVL